MKIVIWLLSIFWVSDVLAMPMVLTGKIPKQSEFAAVFVQQFTVARTIPFNFPRKHYEVKGINIQTLAYANPTYQNAKKIALENYHGIVADGKLDLIKFDKNTGHYQFKLTMTPSMLVPKMFKPMHMLDGAISFKHADAAMIEGEFFYKNKQPCLHNINKNFNQKITVGVNEVIILTPTKDLNVEIILA